MLLFKSFPTFIWLLRDVVLSLPKDCYNIKEYFLNMVCTCNKFVYAINSLNVTFGYIMTYSNCITAVCGDTFLTGDCHVG